MLASVSDDSASFAPRLSSRRRASAARPAGSLLSTSSTTPPGDVEVDTSEALHPFRAPEQLEAFLGLAQHRGVEGAAAEVVDRDDLTGLEPLARRVVDRGGLGLGDEGDPADVGLPDRLDQQILLVGAVVGRVTDNRQVGG